MNGFPDVLLFTKGAWWTRHSRWDMLYVGVPGQHGHCGTRRGTRGNGCGGTVRTSEYHRGTAPGITGVPFMHEIHRFSEKTLLNSEFLKNHEKSSKTRKFSHFGHRTDRNCSHRHLWLVCDPFRKWLIKNTTFRTEVQQWSSDRSFLLL